MDKVFEAYLELNKQMLLNNMGSDYEVTLSKDDFLKLGSYLSLKFAPAIVFENIEQLKNVNWFKVAGPGGYITFRKRD